MAQSLSNCLNEYNLKISNNFEIARQEKWNKERVCMAGKPALEEFQSCYSLVGSKSLLPIDLTTKVIRIMKPGTTGGDVNEVIKTHNSSCINYPEAQLL